MLRTLILCLATLTALPVQALDSATATPSTAYVQGIGAQLVTIRWTIQVSSSGSGAVTIVSNGGTLLAGAQPAVSAGGVLRRTVAAGTTVVHITERLRIDRTSARYILESGGGLFRRTFSDGLTTPVIGEVTLEARSTGEGGLSLQNVDVHFDDASLYRVVGAGAALTAVAKVTTTGRGRIEAVWQIQGPSGGGFRTLRRVTASAAGPRVISLESPPLPTDQPGQYRLRLALGGDGTGTDDPTITYVVGAGGAVTALALQAPAADAVLSAATRFEWTSVKGAVRYRVEFLAQGSAQVVAGVDVKTNVATIKPFTLARLDDGAVTWRVTAYDAAGTVLAQSPARRIGGSFVKTTP